MDAHKTYKSIVLALQELLGDHAGTNIKEVVTQIFQLFGIQRKQARIKIRIKMERLREMER
jgi:hypothetical protein